MNEPSQETVDALRRFWKLDPDVCYLNHGSFGPSPEPVIEACIDWTRRLERQPMRFYCQEAEEHLEAAAATLAARLGTSADRLVPVDNATVAMNAVACSLKLQEHDEVVLTDHEYGAVRNIWSRRCREAGARLVTATLPYPPRDDSTVAAIAAAITERTRLIVISHVTSATACVLPVGDVCRLARSHRIPVCIDGPHAVGMLDVQLDALGCDFYCASCHKWLCAPFGSGFLWVHPRHHASVRHPMTSWGGSISGRSASWKDSFHWCGTRDPAPLLAVSAALKFLSPERLELFRRHAHGLVTCARTALMSFPGVGSFCTPDATDFVSMCAVELPQPAGWKPGYHGHPDPLQLRLRESGIEVPVGSWNGRRYLRVSAHLYNTAADIDRLLSALEPEFSPS